MNFVTIVPSRSSEITRLMRLSKKVGLLYPCAVSKQVTSYYLATYLGRGGLGMYLFVNK